MGGLGPLSKKLAKAGPNAERAENRRRYGERMAGGNSAEADEGNRHSVGVFDKNKLVQVVIHCFNTKQIHVGSENPVASDLLWAPPAAVFSVGLSRTYDICCGVLGILCPSM